MAETLGVAKSTIWFIFKQKEKHWLAQQQQQEKAWKTTEDDYSE